MNIHIQDAMAAAAAQGTRVVHLKVEASTRPIDGSTIWHNPHRPTGQSEAERTACLLAYVRSLAWRKWVLAIAGRLRGHTLGCRCASRPCHGDVLATLASLDTVEERRELLADWERELGGGS